MADESQTQDKPVDAVMQAIEQATTGDDEKPPETAALEKTVDDKRPEEKSTETQQDKELNKEISDKQSSVDKKRNLIEKLTASETKADEQLASILGQAVNIQDRHNTVPQTIETEPVRTVNDDADDVVTKGDLEKKLNSFLSQVDTRFTQAIQEPQRAQAEATIGEFLGELEEAGTLSEDDKAAIKRHMAAFDRRTPDGKFIIPPSFTEVASLLKDLLGGRSSRNILRGLDFKVVDARDKKAKEIKSTTQPSTVTAPVPAQENEGQKLVRELQEAGGNQEVMKRLFHSRK